MGDTIIETSKKIQEQLNSISWDVFWKEYKIAIADKLVRTFLKDLDVKSAIESYAITDLDKEINRLAKKAKNYKAKSKKKKFFGQRSPKYWLNYQEYSKRAKLVKAAKVTVLKLIESETKKVQAKLNSNSDKIADIITGEIKKVINAHKPLAEFEKLYQNIGNVPSNHQKSAFNTLNQKLENEIAVLQKKSELMTKRITDQVLDQLGLSQYVNKIHKKSLKILKKDAIEKHFAEPIRKKTEEYLSQNKNYQKITNELKTLSDKLQSILQETSSTKLFLDGVGQRYYIPSKSFIALSDIITPKELQKINPKAEYRLLFEDHTDKTKSNMMDIRVKGDKLKDFQFPASKHLGIFVLSYYDDKSSNAFVFYSRNNLQKSKLIGNMPYWYSSDTTLPISALNKNCIKARDITVLEDSVVVQKEDGKSTKGRHWHNVVDPLKCKIYSPDKGSGIIQITSKNDKGKSITQMSTVIFGVTP